MVSACLYRYNIAPIFNIKIVFIILASLILRGDYGAICAHSSAVAETASGNFGLNVRILFYQLFHLKARIRIHHPFYARMAILNVLPHLIQVFQYPRVLLSGCILDQCG